MLFLQLWELGHGVIGNTADFGSVIQGSSPCDPTRKKAAMITHRRFRFYICLATLLLALLLSLFIGFFLLLLCCFLRLLLFPLGIPFGQHFIVLL
jgi:hypothetical protein